MALPFTKTVIVVCGPTAVGKTSASIALAKHFSTEIISADSRQCFQELNIGVARPSVSQLSEVPHHFIASHSVAEEITAVSFEQFALEKAAELFTSHDIVLMTGGTGLYIKAFCEGLDAVPSVSALIRQQIVGNYEAKGIEWLQDELQQKDPLYFSAGETQNPQRMMRALEVVEATGQSIITFQKGEKTQRDFNIMKIGLELPREELLHNIDARVNEMIEMGLVDEVKSLLPFRGLNALQTVGYKEIFEYLDGSLSLEEAIERIKINTRQYAKRQMTWFRKDLFVNWFSPSATAEMIAFISAQIKKS